MRVSSVVGMGLSSTVCGTRLNGECLSSSSLPLLSALVRSSGPSEASTLTGTWNGTYMCVQGETGLRLTINAKSDGKLTATFSFYSVPSNPGVPSGDFR